MPKMDFENVWANTVMSNPSV